MFQFQFRKKLARFELNVSVELPEGAVLGLFGPSGCGKSMTLRCLAGLEFPDSGIIQVGDTVLFDAERCINVPPRQRKMGFLFQNYALFPHLTVEKNIEFGLNGLPEDVRKKKVAKAMERMRLKGLEHSYPRQISGGQQQRVALARTLVTDPAVLLLDEPFSALDNQVKSKLEKEIIDVKNTFSGAMVLVTHSLEEAYRLCTHIALMEEGRILQQGSRDEIIRQPINRTVARLVGTKNIYDGRVVKRRKNSATLWIEELGCEMTIPGQPGEAELLSVGIRPGDVKVDYIPRGETNSYPATVTRIIPGVDNALIYLKLTDSPKDDTDYDVQAYISFDDEHLNKLGVGDGCFVYFPISAISVWQTTS